MTPRESGGAQVGGLKTDAAMAMNSSMATMVLVTQRLMESSGSAPVWHHGVLKVIGRQNEEINEIKFWPDRWHEPLQSS